MNEKETKILSFEDIWSVIKKNLVFVLLIIIVCLTFGTLHAFLIKKTVYKVSTTAIVKVEGLQTGGTSNEFNYFSYSVYLAPFCEGVFKNQNNALRYKQETGKSININSIEIESQDQRFDIQISYALQSRDDLSEKVVNQLNDYISWCIDYVDSDENSIWTSLKNRILYDEARYDAVVKTTNKANSIVTALIAGIALSIIFLIIRFYVDDTLTNKDTVESIVGAPVIAAISISANFNREGGQKNEA